MSARWSDPGWREATLGWAEAALGDLGRRVTGPITQPHVRPWSTVFHIQTDAGPAWCKASGPGVAYEGRLLDAFARRGIRGPLLPLAIDPERALMLLPDGGPTLRATRPDGTGDHDLDAWPRILDGYGRLQRATDVHVDDLVTLGVPDLRSDRYVAVVEALVDDDAVWARADEEDRDATSNARRRLPALLPVIAAATEVLAASGIAATIQHDDLHGGNVLVGPDGDRIFDWGDASVAHPFVTLTTTLNSIEHRTGLDRRGPALTRLRDGYLAGWSDVASADVLSATADAAIVLGAVSRAWAWERSFRGLRDDELDGHGGSTAAWLAELVERLERWAAGRPGA